MSSRLETFPREIIQHIAFSTTCSSPFEPPTDLVSLLQTSKAIRHALCALNDHCLFASIFCCKFDTTAIKRRWAALPRNPTLANELVQRFHVLQKVRARSIIPRTIQRDLGTILKMIVESDGLNEWHLHLAGVTEYIVSVCRNPLVGHLEEIQRVALLILSLCLSRTFIAAQTPQWMEETLGYLHPIALSAIVPGSQCFSSAAASFSIGRLQEADPIEGNDLQPKHPSSSAILLTFVLVSAIPLQFPKYEGEEITNPDARPSLADLKAFDGCQASIPGDTLQSLPAGFTSTDLARIAGYLRTDPSRSLCHDREFYRDTAASTQGVFYTPGLIDGLWEGSFMVIPCFSNDVDALLQSGQPPAFICRQPLQLSIRERPQSAIDSDAGLSSEDKSTSHMPFEAKTLPDHGEAWGYYKCTGQVRLSDGLTIFQRRSVHHDDSNWSFEGFLQYENLLVGRCWSGPSLQGSCLRGIFCLGKIPTCNRS
jgi:hypothetical protein